MMTQEQAKSIILDRWREIPANERSAESQAADFAMRVKGEFSFRCKGDIYQVLKGRLLNHLARP